MEVTLLVHQIRLAERVPLSELTHNVKSAEKAYQGIASKQVCQSVTMQASNKVAGAEGIARQDVSANDLLCPSVPVTDVLLRCAVRMQFFSLYFTRV
jgi:hypothetical protein